MYGFTTVHSLESDVGEMLLEMPHKVRVLVLSEELVHVVRSVTPRDLARRVDVRQIRSDPLHHRHHVVQSQFGDIGVQLHEHGQRLADT